MNNDLLEYASELNRAGTAFARATVVRAEKPTSAKPGANAIITGDGALTGWVGGSCTEHTVISQALKALRDGQPRLVRLCPPEKLGAAPQEGVMEVPLTCASGGTLEVYIEPHLPRPHLVVVGHLPVALALARLGSGLGYEVSLLGLDIAPDHFAGIAQVYDNLDFAQLTITPQTYIVVASHGNYDEMGLEGALKSEAPYVALVASRKRAASVVEYLRESGISEDRLARLKVPAGLDIGAVTPEEIAISILAEIVQVRQRHTAPPASPADAPAPDGEQAMPTEAIDPVCGMTVEIATARYTSEHAGQTYYFCAAGCKRSFDRTPAQYVAAPIEAIDPVCGMTVEIATARYTSEHAGQTYYFCAAGCKRSFDRTPAQYVAAPTEAIDPVCGMTVEIAAARYTSEHAGQTYYFCAAGCKRSFDRDPEKYLVTSDQ